jgi:putative phosphoesterase
VVLGLISDVHANVLALEAALKALDRAGADSVLCLGDLVGYGPSPNETLALLRERNVMCCLGDADERIAYRFARPQTRKGVADEILEWTRDVVEEDHVVWLRTLPVQRRLETEAGRLRAFHGSAHDPSERTNLQQDPMALTRVLARHRCQVLCAGGSHVPYYRKVAAAGWVVNPGSVGLSLNGEPGADVCVLRIDDTGVEVRMDKVDYDYAAVAFDIVAWGLPKSVAEAVQFGRMGTRSDPHDWGHTSD